MRVSVIGSSTVDERDAETAERLGRSLAESGHTIVCGGYGGVMEAACRGASDAGGRTIGILSSDDPADANPYIDEPIATGLGHARNALVVMNGEAVIAVDGGSGTLARRPDSGPTTPITLLPSRASRRRSGTSNARSAGAGADRDRTATGSATRCRGTYRTTASRAVCRRPRSGTRRG